MCRVDGGILHRPSRTKWIIWPRAATRRFSPRISRTCHAVHVPRVVWTHTTRRVLTWRMCLRSRSPITTRSPRPGSTGLRWHVSCSTRISSRSSTTVSSTPTRTRATCSSPPSTGQTEEGKTGWQLTFVDFGMVGRVPDNLRAGLREMLIAMGTRDAAHMVHAFQTYRDASRRRYEGNRADERSGCSICSGANR